MCILFTIHENVYPRKGNKEENGYNKLEVSAVTLRKAHFMWSNHKNASLINSLLKKKAVI